MMLDVSTAGYLLATAAYAALLMVLLIGWRRRGVSGVLLITATLLSAIWAAVVAWHGLQGPVASNVVLVAEYMRDTAWVAFLWQVLRQGRHNTEAVPRVIDVVAITAGIVAIASLVVLLAPVKLLYQIDTTHLLLLSKLGLALCVLILVEHYYRCTAPNGRWAIKHICIALAGIYCFDFYRYSEASLFHDINLVMLDARGFVNAVVAPLVAVSASRNPRWKLEVFVSRQVVFHSGVLIVAGIYLMVVASAGYYLREYGGDWGRISQIALIFTAIMILIVVIASHDVRGRVKVFINKHFFHYRFDHREQWMRITQTLIGDKFSSKTLPQRSIRAIADIVDSTGGSLWMRRGDNRYAPTASWNVDDSLQLSVEEEDSLVRFLVRTGWIIELREYREEPRRYGDLELPEQLLASKWIWLIVPLLQDQELVGMVFLAQPRVEQEMNWEVRDLLKVAAHHVASYLQLEETLRALTEARQFEGFNRLSAYVIHDLKNLIAQLSLVMSNAERHRNNPEFLQDVVCTVENSVSRMTKLLEQLRAGVQPAHTEGMELADIVQEAVEACAPNRPLPKMEISTTAMMVKADRERLFSVVKHLIQNAQEATPADGEVIVRTWSEGGSGYLEIEDNGCGMEKEFVQERLFRPFDSTKGLTGMGIGAFEGRELFRALGGDVEVESEPGRGTRLRCRVPLSEPSRQAAPAAIQTASGE